jgi:Flp pilus assembly protein TadD
LSGLFRFQEARAVLKAAQAKIGQSSDIDVELGFISLGEKKYAEAEKVFREHYHPGAQTLRPLAGLVAALEQQGKWEAAAAVIRQDLSDGPDRPFASLMFAQVTATKNPAEAIDQLDCLIKGKPQFSPALMALGELYIRQDEPSKAIPYLERARDLNPANPSPLVLLSGALERAHQEHKAQQAYESWLQLEPDNPIALNNLAYLQSETGGDLDHALRLAKHALEKSPKDANISDTIGWIYLKKRMYSSAEAVFHQITQQYPHNANFRFHYALSYIGFGDKTKARAELRTALSSNPSREAEAQIKQTLNELQAAR